MTAYQEWIDKHYPTPESAKLQCAEATAAMIAEFPELKRVAGYVRLNEDNAFIHGHWWCIDDYFNIVDPTAHQWWQGWGYHKPRLEYEALRPIKYIHQPGKIMKERDVGLIHFRANKDWDI